MKGKRTLLLIVASIVTICVLIGFLKGYDAVWSIWKIPAMTPHFLDLRNLTAGAESISMGYDPLYVNPQDPFGRPICLAGMMALDTDCNCGNIGTIMGVLFGAEKIPKRWTYPLNDEFHTYVKGYEDWKISELAERIAKIGVKVMKEKCPEKLITK